MDLERMLAEDRRAAAEWARGLLAEPEKLAILDSETTGLYGAEFVEVAVVDGNGEVLFESRVKPSVPVEDGARAVHGISDEDLAGAPTFARVWPRLRQALIGRRLVIYNAAFDGPILADSCRKAGAKETIARECAMERWAEWVGEWSEWHGSYRWQKLPGGNHTALGDARATLAVLREMAGDRS